MSTVTVQAEDVWPLVLDFIKQYVGKKELKAFKKQFSVDDSDVADNVLVKAGGMKALLQSFFKSNKKVYKQFVTAKKAA